MKRENNKKFKKRKRNQKRSLTCRVLSMMFAIVLFCSTVLINTDYVSQASSFDDMVDMVEVEEDSAAVDTSEDTGDDLDTDVNFESEEGTDETYSESDDFGSSDADFSSGENMFTDGTSESCAPAEEAAQPVSCIVNLKNETIEIKAEAPAGVLPNGTQMTVKAVENNTEDAEMTDQYNKLAAKITEQLQSQGKNLNGFLAYNVSFTDADGNPVEPAGKVNYSFTYKEASSPELTDPAASTVTAAMIRTNKETSELELTELKAEEDKLTVETNESRQLTKAAFQSAATAAYTFVWSSTPAADDNENNENKEENGEVNNEEVNADTNTENTEENGEETNTENNVENSEEEQNPEEAPDQEQTKMIRIITDEVNLRVAPSTEAEAIATVNTDTQLPLLETVTGEDEFTWYKVSYDETEAYVRSDFAEVVETEEQEAVVEEENEEDADVDINEEDTEGILTFTKKVSDLVEVVATTEAGVIPEDAELVVNPIEKGTDQYTETESRLNEKAVDEGYEVTGFLAYDIYFKDIEGNKLDPDNGKVKVSINYLEPSAPEEVKEAASEITTNDDVAEKSEIEFSAGAEEDDTFQSEETTAQQKFLISIMHLVEDKDGNVQSVVDMIQDGTANLETDTAGAVQKAEFETESFSIFTIAWQATETGYDQTANLSTIETLDHTSAGITMTMTDMEGGSNFSIKRRDSSKWYDLGGGYGEGTDNVGKIKAGLLKNKLENGYPVSTNGNKNLEDLFGHGNKVNHLFSADTYNSTGYYEYSSFKNYAYLENNGNFTVYDALGTPSNEDAYFYQRGNFMPYNRIYSNGISSNKQWYDENGNPLYPNYKGWKQYQDPNATTLYKTNGTNNYYFGMYMSANFLQPKDGKVKAPGNGTTNDMIYEFNGDDDLWVYIDDVLVLDIGGVHEAHSGYINFSSGEVGWYDCKKGGTPVLAKTTIKVLFGKAGVSTNDFDGNTFSDYSKHSFKMFYMERGAGASNLHMKFNLQVVPEGSVEVRKELSNTDKEQYSNETFKFRVYAQKITDTDEKGNETYDAEDYVVLNDAKYKGTTTSIKFATDGTFELKPNESAIFSGLKANRKYYVEEVGVDTQKYNIVKINGVEKSAQDSVQTDKQTVEARPSVVYTNNCSEKYSRSLQITKKLQAGETRDKFSFKIQLSNKNNENLVPYANGKYYLQDASGNYYYYNVAGALVSNENVEKPCGTTSTDGIIANVPVNYKVTIKGILAGTSFKVEETGLDSNRYNNPEISVSNAGESEVEGVGSIQFGEDANVIVTNSLKSQDTVEDETFIEVSKTFKGLTAAQIGELANANPPYKITVTGKKQGETPGSLVDFSQDLLLNDDGVVATGSATTWTYTWKIKGCGTGRYTIKESGYSKAGYLVDVQINGNTVTNPENAGVEVETKAASYNYTSKEKVTNCNKENYEVGEQNLIVAKLTKGEGTFVWTKKPASVNERLAIIELIKNINGFNNNASLSNCYFYSGTGITGTLIFRGAEIKYDCINTLHFDYPKQWAMFAVGTYEILGGDNAEVKITNTYNEQTTDLDLVKVSKNDTNSKLDGAAFQLYKKENGTYQKSGDPITIKNGETDIELIGLKPGEYYLEETKAPVGYMLLGKKIYFKQVDGNISLTDEQVTESVEKPEFWSLSTTNEKNVLTIQNQILYSLPSTGGNGIYWYMIGGMVLMSTAAWILYKNKCREVLGK